MNDELIIRNVSIVGAAITGVRANGLLALRRLPFPLLISRLITRLIE
jgi:hypothetical protein